MKLFEAHNVIVFSLLVLAFLFILIGCKKYSQTNSTFKTSSIENTQNKDSIYFALFPDNFNEFNEIYGYSDKTGPGRLYNQYEQDIRYFCDSLNVNIEDKLMKLTSISIGGRWDADAISLLQACVRQQILIWPNIVFELVAQKTVEESKSFWFFILDCPHPEDKEEIQYFNNLYKIAEQNKSNQLNLIMEVHQEIILEEH